MTTETTENGDHKQSLQPNKEAAFTAAFLLPNERKDNEKKRKSFI